MNQNVPYCDTIYIQFMWIFYQLHFLKFAFCLLWRKCSVCSFSPLPFISFFKSSLNSQLCLANRIVGLKSPEHAGQTEVCFSMPPTMNSKITRYSYWWYFLYLIKYLYCTRNECTCMEGLLNGILNTTKAVCCIQNWLKCLHSVLKMYSKWCMLLQWIIDFELCVFMHSFCRRKHLFFLYWHVKHERDRKSVV